MDWKEKKMIVNGEAYSRRDRLNLSYRMDLSRTTTTKHSKLFWTRCGVEWNNSLGLEGRGKKVFAEKWREVAAKTFLIKFARLTPRWILKRNAEKSVGRVFSSPREKRARQILLSVFSKPSREKKERGEKGKVDSKRERDT